MKNINSVKTKNYIFKFSTYAFLSFPLFLAANSSIYSLNAEPDSFLPESMIAKSGESKNNSLSTGTRATLSLGTSSSFGSSANVSSTDAYKIDAVSAFVPISGNWSSGFGMTTTTTKDKDGLISKSSTTNSPIKANVGNIRSAGTGTFFSNLDSTPIGISTTESEGSTSTTSSITPADSDTGYALNAKNADTAEGEATLEGVSSEIELTLDPESTFTSTTITYLSDNKDENPMATANGAANLGLNNSLNVDLANTAFSNAFSQAFGGEDDI